MTATSENYVIADMQNFEDNPIIITNFRIASIAFLPFCCLEVAFLVVVCRRKIEDYYLRYSIIFLVASMALRTLMCMVIVITVIVADENEDSLKLLEFKLQVIQFSVPYYFFFMVFVALFFSAHTFYTGLRNALFPQLRENDD